MGRPEVGVSGLANASGRVGRDDTGEDEDTDEHPRRDNTESRGEGEVAQGKEGRGDDDDQADHLPLVGRVDGPHGLERVGEQDDEGDTG